MSTWEFFKVYIEMKLWIALYVGLPLIVIVVGFQYYLNRESEKRKVQVTPGKPTKGREIMDKIYIIRYKDRLLRIYSSKSEAEKYYYHVRDSLVNGEKFTISRHDFSQVEVDL